ncbi:MAG: hypothetical protein ACYTG2_00750 [Planctomycetota bacterium]|jgi:hypothetical protein
MRSVLLVFGVLGAGVACGGEAAPTGPVILGMPSAGDAEEVAAAGEATPADAKMDPGRDYSMERESFERLTRSGRADPDEVREALGIAPDFRFSYETLAGDSMAGAEYRIKGPRPGAPFFEAFAAEHEGESFYVFYERGWFQTRAVDCGFQLSGMYGAQYADG